MNEALSKSATNLDAPEQTMQEAISESRDDFVKSCIARFNHLRPYAKDMPSLLIEVVRPFAKPEITFLMSRDLNWHDWFIVFAPGGDALEIEWGQKIYSDRI